MSSRFYVVKKIVALLPLFQLAFDWLASLACIFHLWLSSQPFELYNMPRDFLQVRVKSVFPLGHCQEMAGGQRFTALPSSFLSCNSRFDQQVLGLLCSQTQ